MHLPLGEWTKGVGGLGGVPSAPSMGGTPAWSRAGLRVAPDSSPLWKAGRVEDTFRSPRKLAQCAAADILRAGIEGCSTLGIGENIFLIRRVCAVGGLHTLELPQNAHIARARPETAKPNWHIEFFPHASSQICAWILHAETNRRGRGPNSPELTGKFDLFIKV